MLPDGAALEILSLSGIPPFNQDLENDIPTNVKEFKSKIMGANAILIATPEYNLSVAGVVNNAIDWASRQYGVDSFNGKPVAIVSASIGMLRGARDQYHLRQMFVFLSMYPVIAPEVIVTFAKDMFDANDKLVDENTKTS